MDGEQTSRHYKRDMTILVSTVGFLYFYLLGQGIYTLAETLNYKAQSAIVEKSKEAFPDLDSDGVLIERGSGYNTPVSGYRTRAGIFYLAADREITGKDYSALEDKLNN